MHGSISESYLNKIQMSEIEIKTNQIPLKTVNKTNAHYIINYFFSLKNEHKIHKQYKLR